ncbi:phospholipase B [Coprinopsis cinerea okayama7|uniref:Lysophospholipase n=1 Tax=Coprinopsis cinerea (strain Okayama-7 / 130 / ATCC MYA-4618 / FGSC 9003) TaxID=240176 RepID=D6RLD8_COPC7|nr:phospholipase B [Coprinopsis cinerea okayama7\|eukprot:XP_002911698.1 phospholipase B [Coprinopsis cinerea okayama7\
MLVLGVLPPTLLGYTLLYLTRLCNGQVIPVLNQQSPTDYAPIANVDCPDISTNPLVRQFPPENQTLHPAEVEYVETRASTVLPGAWADWLGDGSALGYDLTAFEGNFPKVGIAIPGGGLRAAQYGAACLNALDARNNSAKAAGTGGLLQVASYMTGLSGGSWITASLFFNDWPTLNDLVFGHNGLNGWRLDTPLVTPDGSNILSKANQWYFGSILWSVMAKAKFVDTSLTDPWSRMISYHFLNQTTRDNIFSNETAHGAGQLWSKVPELDSYKEFRAPFPMIVANARPVGSNATTILSLDATVYEITPLELASYDPGLSAGMNLTYAGTHLNNGRPENGSACMVGFDQVGFVMGTSASLFNQLFDFARNTINGFSESDEGGLLYVLGRQLRAVRTRADDVANWPSPFQGLREDTFQDSDANWLELIDGSSNQENVPYGPLFVKARGLDVIVTAEGSADIPGLNWPNGSSLITTKQRQETILRLTHQAFPPIPKTPQEFIETGVNARPTFFGCDPSTPSDYPLVIYLPNAPPVNGDDPHSNTATFQLSYTLKHTRLMFDQIHTNLISGFKPDTNDADPDWGICLQCAAIDRARFKVSPTVERSEKCTECFQRYCYDPQNPPSKSQLPNRKLEFVDPDPQGFDRLGGFFHRNRFALIGGLIGLIVFIAGLIVGLLWWKKNRDRKRDYQRVLALHQDDDDPLFQHGHYSSYEMHQKYASDTSYDPPKP